MRNLNSMERFVSSLELEEPDCVPFAPLISVEYIPEVCDVTHTRFMYADNHFRASCYVKANKKFDTDWIYTTIGRSTESQKNLKVSWSHGYAYVHDLVKDDTTKLPEDEYPYEVMERAPYKYKNDPDLRRCINDYKSREGTYTSLVPSAAWKGDVFDEGCLEQIEEIVKLAGDEKYINYQMGGPGYGSFALLGEKYYLSFYREPERLKELMRLITENQKELIDLVAPMGIDGISLGDGMVGADCISAKFYAEFIQPFHKRLIRRIRRKGLYSILWFWGDPTDRLKELAQVKPHCLWVEESMRNYTIDLRKVKEVVGDQLCLMGNIDGRKLLNPKGVLEEVRRCVGSAAAGGGYIFSTGRPLSGDIPLENVAKMHKLLKKNGRYPLTNAKREYEQ